MLDKICGMRLTVTGISKDSFMSLADIQVFDASRMIRLMAVEDRF